MVVKRQHGSRLPVKNRRLVDTALNTMRNLRVANSENVDNAIQGTGFPITVYNRLMHGQRCTCSFQSRRLLDESGNMPDSAIQAIIGYDSGLVDYADDHAHTQIIGNNSEVVHREHVNNKASDYDPVFGESTLEEDEEDELTVQRFNLDDGSVDESQLRISRADSHACGLCFGSTYAGGYTLIHGQRTVLSSVDNPIIDMGAIDVTASPNRIDLMIEGYVEWTITVSRASQWSLEPLAYNNTKQVHQPYRIEYFSVDEWVELGDPLHLADGLPHRVRLVNLDDKPLQFSHVEFVYSFRDNSDPHKGDFPAIQKMTNMNILDALSGTTIIMSGEMLLNKLSVIVDHLPYMSRHWIVSNVAPRRDNYGHVYDTTCEARALDTNELGQLLRPLASVRQPLI